MAIEFQAISTTLGISYFDVVTYLIPKQCPHCYVWMIPSTIDAKQLSYDLHFDMNFLSHSCVGCKKSFVTTHFRKTSNNSITFHSVYPEMTNKAVPIIIAEFSPQFANIYRQAALAENLDQIELATTGYRMALEILVKDYLIAEFPELEEQIKYLSLHQCLTEYFKDISNSVAAHVVKSLSNDYVHYIKKHTHAGFEELKFYFEIFVNDIETKLKLKKPIIKKANILSSMS